MFKTKTKTKRLLILSGILCGAGTLIAAIAFAFCNFDIWKVSAMPPYYESDYTYSIDEISDLKLELKGQPVEIRTSTDDKVHVTAWENERVKFSAEKTPDALSLSLGADIRWYDQFIYGFFSQLSSYQYRSIIEIPSSYQGDFTIFCSETTVDLKGFQALRNLEIKNSNGSIFLESISSSRCFLSTSNSSIICKELKTGEMEAYSSNGGIALEKVTADNVHTGTSNSSIAGKAITAGEITVTNSNGSISLTEINADGLTASTSNSSNHLENVSITGSVILSNSNGSLGIQQVKAPNIDLSTSNSQIFGVIIGNQQDYSIEAKTSNGDSNLANSTGGQNRLKVSNSNGDIHVTFSQD